MRLLPVQWSWYLIGNPLCRFFLRPTVIVPANLQLSKTQPLIIAANHVSRFDPFLTCLLPRPLPKQIVPVTFLTAEKYYEMWWLKPFLWALGSIPVKRFGWSLDDYLDKAAQSLRSGRTMVVFPEGQMGLGNQKPKPGIGYLVTAADAEVLPAYIAGIENLSFKDFFLRKRRLQLTLGETIRFNNKSSDIKAYQEIAERVMQQINALA